MQHHQKAGMSKEIQNQKEQISLLFQENCSLKEKLARLDNENKNSHKEKSDLKRAHEKLIKFVEDMQKKKTGSEDSIHSSIESGSLTWNKSNNSAANAISDVGKAEPKSNGSSDLCSLEDTDATEELILERLNISLKNLTDLKSDLSFVNHSLKYFLYFVYNTKQKEKCLLRRTGSYLVARGGGEPDSLEEPQKWSPSQANNPIKKKIGDFEGNRTFQQTKESGNFSETSQGEEILGSFFKRRHLPWHSPTSSDTSVEGNRREFYDRGISTEALASSSILSPDSLSSFHETSESEGGASSVLLKEERVCPICEAVFPESIPQREFEQHAENHFVFDEYELVN